MRRTLAPLVTIALGLFAGSSSAADLLYVQNTWSGDLTVIDVSTRRQVDRIEIGKYPDDVVASPDGKVIYVNRIDSAGLKQAPNVGDTGEVIAISTATGKVLWRVPVPGMPHHMTVTLDGGTLFVPYFNSTWIGVIDTAKHEVVDRIGVPYGMHGTRLSPDGTRLYAGSMMNDLVAVIDVATRKVIQQIPFDDGVRPFDVTADGKWMYAQRSRLHGFEVIDLAAGRKVRTVPLPALPAGTKLPEFYPHTYDHGLSLSHRGKLLFAAGSVGGYVAAYSVPDLKLLGTVPVGVDPNWIVFDDEDRFAYVSNRGSDDLSIISIADLKEVARLPVGRYPQRIQLVHTEGSTHTK